MTEISGEAVGKKGVVPLGPDSVLKRTFIVDEEYPAGVLPKNFF